MVFGKDEVIQGKVWFWVVVNKAVNSEFQIVMLVLSTWVVIRSLEALCYVGLVVSPSLKTLPWISGLKLAWEIRTTYSSSKKLENEGITYQFLYKNVSVIILMCLLC